MAAWPRAPAAAPFGADIVLAADSEIVPGRVAHGATFGGLLSQPDLHAPDIDGVLAAMSGIFDPKEVRGAGLAVRADALRVPPVTLHLSSIAAGIRPGVHVARGQ